MDKKKTVNIDMKQYGMVLALIAVFLIFAVMTGGKNMSPANINNLIMQNGCWPKETETFSRETRLVMLILVLQ